MIETKNLNFQYDKRFYTLYNINLKFIDNKRYMIFSEQELESKTLFRILTKQEKEYKGDVFFDGKDLKEISIKNLDICYITNSPILFKHKSVLYNIAYPLIVRKSLLNNEKYLSQNIDNNSTQYNKKIKLKYTKNNTLLIAEKLLEKYNLVYLKNKKIINLTAKERLLLLLLRCAIRNPKIIICDYFNFDLFDFNLFFEITKNSMVLISTSDKNMLNELNKNIDEKDKQFKLIKFVGGSVED